MKRVTLLAEVQQDVCRGCKVCEKVCPVYAISVTDRKAKVKEDACRGCTNCESRCPFHAIKMVKREKPFTIGVDASQYDSGKIRELCEKAHLNPEQVICYCVGVRAEEVAAAIMAGAKTPDEISSVTGIRTGCTIECIQPLLRLIQAAGIELKRDENGWQWYGVTPTAWTLPEDVVQKYNKRGFYFEEDKQLLDRVVHTNPKGEEKK
ncbi:4Fe-4S binding protein [Caproiciproducens sp. CPB-2]|uniref:4Fe-4S binding protein n=1 Tax=Caproiciproducens sp. CPB-2 TaxID=3030017 RepID=UPI0023DABB8A|nr:4Fe-4S binding protein [Caproiciproducens sp. CPB-2]MDF1494906.1 4Fe-4S binding protein [Caproiciproducens sp. CPB-2]